MYTYFKFFCVIKHLYHKHFLSDIRTYDMQCNHAGFYKKCKLFKPQYCYTFTFYIKLYRSLSHFYHLFNIAPGSSYAYLGTVIALPPGRTIWQLPVLNPTETNNCVFIMNEVAASNSWLLQ